MLGPVRIGKRLFVKKCITSPVVAPGGGVGVGGVEVGVERITPFAHPPRNCIISLQQLGSISPQTGVLGIRFRFLFLKNF